VQCQIETTESPENLEDTLQRLMKEQERLVAEIKSHKAAWADRNFLSQKTHETIPVEEIRAFKQHHRNLSTDLAAVNIRVGATNASIREERANGSRGRAPAAAPRKDEFAAYFLMAAEQELDKKVFDHIVAVAKSAF
jgi:hypothetical protein